MPSFAAPVEAEAVPPVLPVDDVSQTVLGKRLFRHYRSRPAGVNLFIYSDDLVSLSGPDGVERVWSASDRTGDNPSAPYVTHVFWGGHAEDQITDAEATLLTDAGYTVIP